MNYFSFFTSIVSGTVINRRQRLASLNSSMSIASILNISILIVSALIAGDVHASSSPASLPFHAESKKTNWAFEQGIQSKNELILKGETFSDQARLLIRIDHSKSHHYFSRFNHEQLVNKGPFVVKIDLDNLKTGHKLPFSSDQIRRIYYASLNGDVTLSDVVISPKPQAPESIIGWDFGSRESSGAWGFYPVHQGSNWEDIGGKNLRKPNNIPLQGNLRSRNRPYHDSLIRDGFEGIDVVHLPLKNGFWRIRLWTSDIGEWEYLSHPLNRKITVNGQTVLSENLTPDEWREAYYFKQPNLYQTADGYEADSYKKNRKPDEATLATRFWNSFLINRGNPVDSVVEVVDEQLVIKLESDVPSGKFLSAVIATPLSSTSKDGTEFKNSTTAKNNTVSEDTFEQLDKLREQSFKEQWPILPNKSSWEEEATWLAFADRRSTIATGELLNFKITFDRDFGLLLSQALPLEQTIWLKEMSILGRVGGQESALTTRTYLSTFDPKTTSAKAGETWYLLGKVQEKVKEKAPKQEQKDRKNSQVTGVLHFANGHLQHAFQLLPLTLPKVQLPIGIYLDYAPHLSWFSKTHAVQQSQCDYDFLKRIGLTGVAPALPTPSIKKESIRDFQKAIQTPLLAGLNPPFPAYTPLKRMTTMSLHEQVSTLQQLRRVHALTMWSLADEPGLFIEMDAKLDKLNRQLKDLLPSIKRYAQLNHEGHSELIGNYTDVLINQGYGLTQKRFDQLKQSNTRYFLYNLPDLRYSSGLYLWRSKAKGFWQWHGRMPTANPFDPTDGREDDVQFILPTPNGCDFPTIRSDLISIRSGINDFKWLSWLSQNANHDIHFAILQHKLEQEISIDYEDKSIKNIEIDLKITQIKDLAQSMLLSK